MEKKPLISSRWIPIRPRSFPPQTPLTGLCCKKQSYQIGSGRYSRKNVSRLVQIFPKYKKEYIETIYSEQKSILKTIDILVNKNINEQMYNRNSIYQFLAPDGSSVVTYHKPDQIVAGKETQSREEIYYIPQDAPLNLVNNDISQKNPVDYSLNISRSDPDNLVLIKMEGSGSSEKRNSYNPGTITSNSLEQIQNMHGKVEADENINELPEPSDTQYEIQMDNLQKDPNIEKPTEGMDCSSTLNTATNHILEGVEPEIMDTSPSPTTNDNAATSNANSCGDKNHVEMSSKVSPQTVCQIPVSETITLSNGKSQIRANPNSMDFTKTKNVSMTNFNEDVNMQTSEEDKLHADAITSLLMLKKFRPNTNLNTNIDSNSTRNETTVNILGEKNSSNSSTVTVDSQFFADWDSRLGINTSSSEDSDVQQEGVAQQNTPKQRTPTENLQVHDNLSTNNMCWYGNCPNKNVTAAPSSGQILNIENSGTQSVSCNSNPHPILTSPYQKNNIGSNVNTNNINATQSTTNNMNNVAYNMYDPSTERNLQEQCYRTIANFNQHNDWSNIYQNNLHPQNVMAFPNMYNHDYNQNVIPEGHGAVSNPLLQRDVPFMHFGSGLGGLVVNYDDAPFLQAVNQVGSTNLSNPTNINLQPVPLTAVASSFGLPFLSRQFNMESLLGSNWMLALPVVMDNTTQTSVIFPENNETRLNNLAAPILVQNEYQRTTDALVHNEDWEDSSQSSSYYSNSTSNKTSKRFKKRWSRRTRRVIRKCKRKIKKNLKKHRRIMKQSIKRGIRVFLFKKLEHNWTMTLP